LQHIFDVDIAVKYGVLEAILIKNIYYWIAKNKANNKNYYDGSYWTYNSIKAFKELFPYASERQISNALKHLEKEGIIKVGNYNKSAYDRTNWYAFNKNATSILQKCKMEDTKVQNGFDEIDTPIPNINTNINSDINTNKEKKKFNKPTIEQIQEYCIERNNGINAEAFYDFYESKNWYVGKNKMSDWKACVRTWERRTNKHEKPTPSWFNQEIKEEDNLTDEEREWLQSIK
jgi:hypothetical protein